MTTLVNIGPTAAAPSEPARVVVADPAWRFGDSLPGPKRGASKHYDTMTTAKICALQLPPIASDAVLFLWRVAAMMQDALDVAAAWGFVPKSEIVWVKTTRRASPDAGATKLHFGMGRQVRASHESCIIATRGKAPPQCRSIRSVFMAPVGVHSAKPDAFYELVEQMHEGPYLELFARRQRPGWLCIGSDLGTRLEAAS